MPREITKYLCEFKCGKKAQSTLSQIRVHEKKCWKNPEIKSCSTCKHEVYEKDGDMFKKWMNRGCKVLSEEDFDSLLSKSDYHTTPIFHKQPVINCPYHELK